MTDLVGQLCRADLATMTSFTAFLDQVYPALDDGKYDVALKLCLNPEVAKFTLAKALLSYTYSCMRNYGKALEIARAVAATQPSEDSVVSTLGCTFKILKAETEFAELYENALKKKNLDASYVIELFSCYCRQNDPKKMQFIAQKLHKATPDKVCYLYWSIACMMLQDLPPTMMVLAEKMAFKVLYDLNALTQPSADEMGLYSFILVRQGKFSQALDSLVQLRARPSNTLLIDETHFQENPNLVKMLDLQFAVHKMDLLIRQNRLAEVIVEGKKLLEKFPDQWNVHKVIVDCLLRSGSVINSGGSSTSTDAKQLVFPHQDLSALLQDMYPAPDLCTSTNNTANTSTEEKRAESKVIIIPAVVTQVHQHVAYLHNLQAAQSKLRGPYLAELYLLTQYTHHLVHTAECASLPALWPVSTAPSDGSADISELCVGLDASNQLHNLVYQCVVLIAAYVRRFSTKQCCFSDVKSYIHAALSLESEILSTNNNSSGVTTDTMLFNNLRQWGIQGRVEKLTILQSAMDAATALANEKTTAVHSATVVPPPAPASSPVAAPAGAPAPPGAATEEAEAEEEGEAEDNEDPVVTTDSTTTAAGGTAGAGAAKKKKNKKKKKSAAAKTVLPPTPAGPVATTVKPVDSSVVNEHQDILLYLCAYCKYDQLVSYCDYLLHTRNPTTSVSTTTSTTTISTSLLTSSELASIQQRIALYTQSIRLFHNGVGGEPRNVQPGDELILQNSSLFRTAYAQATSGGLAKVTLSEERDVISAVQWGKALQQGREASPYAFAFRMDILEPYRVLGMGEAALEAFKELGVKHIQHDSLSYLVLPTLLESGFFMEAAKQMNAVCNFHIIGQRDSLDMLSRAFQYGNYMKVIELSRFVDHCQRSTQLAASRAEIPLLELVDGHSTAENALKYLENVIVGDKALSQPLLDATALNNLVDHMDYDLQVRTDQKDETAKKNDAKLYRQQILQRIQASQRVTHMLYHALKHNADEALGHLESYVQVVQGQKELQSNPTYHPWDQSVQSGDPLTSLALQEAVSLCYKLCLRFVASSGTSTSKAAFDSVEEVTSATTAAVRALFTLKEAFLQTVPFLEIKTLSPAWLKSQSHFVRTIGTELSLLLQVCIPLHTVAASSTKAFTTETSLSDYEERLRSVNIEDLPVSTTLDTCVRVLTAAFRGLLESVQQRIDSAAVTLTTLSIQDLAQSLSAADGTPTHVATACSAGEEDSTLNLQSVKDVVDLCGDDFDVEQKVVQSAVSAATVSAATAGLNAVAAEKQRVKDAKKAAASSNSSNVPKVSKDVSDPAALQLLLAGDLLSSHTESCLRLAGILSDKIKALHTALP